MKNPYMVLSSFKQFIILHILLHYMTTILNNLHDLRKLTETDCRPFSNHMAFQHTIAVLTCYCVIRKHDNAVGFLSNDFYRCCGFEEETDCLLSLNHMASNALLLFLFQLQGMSTILAFCRMIPAVAMDLRMSAQLLL